jgi:hypothetical protein
LISRVPGADTHWALRQEGRKGDREEELRGRFERKNKKRHERRNE